MTHGNSRPDTVDDSPPNLCATTVLFAEGIDITLPRGRRELGRRCRCPRASIRGSHSRYAGGFRRLGFASSPGHRLRALVGPRSVDGITSARSVGSPTNWSRLMAGRDLTHEIRGLPTRGHLLGLSDNRGRPRVHRTYQCGLDVHARSVVAAAIDGVTDELIQTRLTPSRTTSGPD